MFCGASGARGGHSGVTTTPVSFSLGTSFLQLLSQGFSPVCLLCSQRIAHLSWNLNLILGSSSEFSMGLVLVGGGAPPCPPLPFSHALFLCSIVAHDCHQLHSMTLDKIGGSPIY